MSAVLCAHRAVLIILVVVGMLCAGCGDDTVSPPDCPDCPDCPENPDDPVIDVSVITGDVSATTQQQLEALVGVREIIGELTIVNTATPDSIRSLAPLASLRSVERLSIEGTALTDLSGLDSLTSISGRLRLRSCAQLATLAGIDSLVYAQELNISALAVLADIEALGRLVGLQRVALEYLPALESADAFSNLDAVTYMHFGYCDALTDLPCAVPLPLLERVTMRNLPSVTSLALGSQSPPRLSSLHVADLGGLRNMDGLGHLSSLVVFEADGLPLLEDLEGMGSLADLQRFELEDTPSLVSLEGMGMLPSLRDCSMSGPSALTSLEGLPGLPGLYYLTIAAHDQLSSLVGISSAPLLRSVSVVGCPDLSGLAGLSELPQVEEIGFTDCPGLTGLDSGHDWPELQTADLNNVGLTDLTSLHDMPHLGGLILENCGSLQSLVGVQHLDELVYFSVDGCPSLADLGPGETKPQLHMLWLMDCDGLTDLEGLGYLPTISAMRIRDCGGLQDLTGVVLPDTMERVEIWGNDNLIGLDGLGGVERLTSSLNVLDNPLLTSLDGLTDLNAVHDVSIRDNVSLGNATAMAFVNALDEWDYLIVGGNEPGKASYIERRREGPGDW